MSAPISQLDRHIMARTIIGESRGEPVAGRAAVGWVIRNRWKQQIHAESTIAGTCLKRAQFSCWNENDPNRNLILGFPETSDMYEQTLEIVDDILSDVGVDPTAGSLHYHAKGITPDWVVGHTPVIELGKHLFFNDVA